MNNAAAASCTRAAVLFDASSQLLPLQVSLVGQCITGTLLALYQGRLFVFSLSFCVSNEVTSAFGVFRECFISRFVVARSEYMETGLPVEFNGPKIHQK